MDIPNSLIRNQLFKADPIIEDWEFSDYHSIKRNNFEYHYSTFEFSYSFYKYRLNLLSKKEIEAGKKLSDVIEMMPHGIIDKRVTGLGATTLEIKSQRNSIIVMPTRALAYSKSLKHPHTLYVGSKYQNNTDLKKESIQSYLNNELIPNKKFLVVADSLARLIDEIGGEVYDNYFFMIDEVDLIQADSNYRPALENAMDYYFKFPKKSRCLVSATINEFSNPALINECRFILSDFEISRNIRLLHTDNLISLVKSEIELHNNEKILIAFNGITEIRSIILLLANEHVNDCGILCSEASRNEAGEFFAELDDTGILTKRITFMTCSYFSGLDFDDSYHLITVSNVNKFYQVLSLDKMTQIAGRCRIKNGLLSETIIFNTSDNEVVKVEEGFGNYILSVVNKIINVINYLDELTKNDLKLQDLYDMLKQGIEEKSYETVKGENIKLVRKNIDGIYVPAYLNIDSIFEKHWLNSNYYINYTFLLDSVQRNHQLIFFDNIFLDVDTNQSDATNEIKTEFSDLYDQYIIDAIEEIKILDLNEELDDIILKKRIRNSKRNLKDFYERFQKIYKYIEVAEIIEPLYEIRIGNNKAFKKLNNAVVFHALEPNHPFKLNILNSFEQKRLYTSDEIFQIMTEIVGYHLKVKITKNIAIGLLQSFFVIHRPRDSYRVLGINPYNFS
jgi:hypothetical protein